MNREAIVHAASKMESTHDLLVLLNKIKMGELGDKGHPFTMPQLNFFLNPKRTASHYKTFSIPKKSGGFRTIDAPVKMLKSIQTYINRILQAFYQAPECVTGFVPAKSVVDNAERHIGMNYVFNTDLKDFFPSISQARVWGALKTRPFNLNEKVASAIAGLCCKEVIEQEIVHEEGELFEKPKDVVKHVLPQGSPCSPTLTNIVCHNLDWKLSGLAKRFHLRYSRYADDITFSGNQNVFQEDGAFMTELRRIIGGQNFTINEKKTRLQKVGQRQEVTGLVVSDRVNVPREFVRDLDNLLFIWERHGHNAAFAKFMVRYVPKQNLIDHTPNMETVVAGKLMYLRMVKGENSQVWRKLQKRFNRLVDRKESSGGTDIIYLHDYTIEAFEAATGATIGFRYNPNYRSNSYISTAMFDDEDAEEKRIYQIGSVVPTFTLNGRTYDVNLSKYAKTRIKNILDSGDAAQLANFRKRFHIAFCKYDVKTIVPEEQLSDRDVVARADSIRFWMIYRGPQRKKKGTAEEPSLEEILELVGKVGTTPEALPDDLPAADGLTTDQILETLVKSDFDLNTLDEWDKIKNS